MKKILIFIFICFFICFKSFSQLRVPILNIQKQDLQFVCNNYDTLIFALYIENNGSYHISVFGQAADETDDITSNFPEVAPVINSRVATPCLISISKCSTKKLKRYIAQHVSANSKYYFLALNDDDPNRTIQSMAMFIQAIENNGAMDASAQQINPVPPKKPTKRLF